MNKKNLYLGGVLAVLILGAWLFNGPVKEWRSNWGVPKNFFSGLDFNKIDRIEIVENGKEMGLTKTDNRWLIDGTKDFFVSAQITDLLKTALEKARDNRLELASENPEKRSDFGTGDNGATVRLKQGDSLLFEFIVGKASDDFTGSYFSPANQEKTYLAAANLHNALVRSDWYDKTIFSADKNTITKLRFQYPGTEFTIERKDLATSSEESEPKYLWEGSQPYKFSVNQEKIGEILEVMSGLQAVRIPEQSFTGSGLEKNLIIVEASGEGFSNTIMVGTSPDEAASEPEYFAKRGDSDNIFLIDKGSRDLLETTIRELR